MEIPYLSKTQTHKALDPHRAQRHAHPVSLLSCYLFERGVPARLVTGPQPPGLSPLSNPCLGDSAVPPALKHAPGSPVFKCFLIPLHYHPNFLLPSNADCLKTRLHFLPLPFSSLSPRLAPSRLQPHAPTLALNPQDTADPLLSAGQLHRCRSLCPLFLCGHRTIHPGFRSLFRPLTV